MSLKSMPINRQPVERKKLVWWLEMLLLVLATAALSHV